MNRAKDIVLSEKGGLNYVNVILIIILVGMILAGWTFIPGVYQAFTLAHFAEGQAIKASEMQDQEIRENIRKESEKLGVDQGSLVIVMQRFGGKVTIDIDFDRMVPIPGLNDKSIHFHKKIVKQYGDIIHLDEDSKIKKYK